MNDIYVKTKISEYISRGPKLLLERLFPDVSLIVSEKIHIARLDPTPCCAGDFAIFVPGYPLIYCFECETSMDLFNYFLEHSELEYDQFLAIIEEVYKIKPRESNDIDNYGSEFEKLLGHLRVTVKLGVGDPWTCFYWRGIYRPRPTSFEVISTLVNNGWYEKALEDGEVTFEKYGYFPELINDLGRFGILGYDFISTEFVAC